MFLISAGSPQNDSTWKTSLAEGRVADPERLAEFLLGKVSRTFALNIQVLPAGLRRQVLLAYLFCRMADTLEDDPELPADEKIRLLERFRGLFPPSRTWQTDHEALVRALPESWKGSEKWDRLLVAHGRWIFSQLVEFPDPVVDVISSCVKEMCDGMIQFTARQAKARENASGLIATVEDLDSYCYYVAGTVGNMLCDLFTLQSPLIGKRRAKALKSLSVSFGLGLQLTNILKDVQEDRERNVSFIPQTLLAEEGLSQADFLAPQGREGAARILDRLIEKARRHLEDALEYTCLLPRLEPRLRLFCLWPLFMAAETLALLGRDQTARREGPLWGPGIKLKISRGQVSRILRRTSFACWSNSWIRSMFRETMAGPALLRGAAAGSKA
jgi:farnesyl-diphosphate farnesyltransferase